MKLIEFENEWVKFIETLEVKSWVICDVYEGFDLRYHAMDSKRRFSIFWNMLSTI